MKMIRWVTLLCVALVPVCAQDPTKIAPQGYTVEAENDLVRIIHMHRPAYDKAPMHEHPPYVVVFFRDMHQKVTNPDGTFREGNRKAGECVFNDARRHAEENLSDQPIDSLIIELKPKARQGPSYSIPAVFDVTKVDPEHYKIEVDNEFVRVLRLKRGSLEQTGMHEHPNSVSVFLTDVHQRVTDDNGTSHEVNRKRGEFELNPPIKHAEQTLAGPPVEVILVELKKTAPIDL